MECENTQSMDIIRCIGEQILLHRWVHQLWHLEVVLLTRARWCGGGGNCIKIKHNSTYETIYAHMKNFARGIKEGVES